MNNYVSYASSREIRTSNLSIFNNMFTTMDVPVGELVSNAVDAVTGSKVKIVDIAFEKYEDGNTYIVVKNTGKPIKDIPAMLDLGHKEGEVKPDCTTNHLRGVGFKYPVGYFSPKDNYFSIETKHRDGWYMVSGPYKETVDIQKFATSDYIHGNNIVTKIAIRVEREISEEEKNNTKEFLRRKFSVAMMKDKSLKIFFDGEQLSYVIHGENVRSSGNVIDDKDEIINRLFVNAKDCEARRAEVKLVKKGAFTFAEVDCPIVNGKLHILSMQAEPNFDGVNIMGVSVFNLGTLVEHSCGDVISKPSRRATDRLNNFKPMPSTRNEFAQLATYVDIIPGEGYIPSYTSDKLHVNWNVNETSRKLRVFIDDVVGGYYREFVRIHTDSESREGSDEFLENMFEAGNYAYIREAVIWKKGFKGKISDCARVDGILVKKTPKNIDKINEYKKSLYSGGRRITYKLEDVDFDKEMIEPPEETRTEGWTYDVKIVEYKNIKNPHLTDNEIACAEKYVKYIAKVFGLDRKRLSIVLVGNVDEDNNLFKEYLEISREDGFNITIAKPPVPNAE